MTTPLEAFKIHLNITDDEDDNALGQCLDAATAWVKDVIGRPVVETDPATIQMAVRMLAAHFFESREATIAGVSLQETPFGVMSLLDAHRYWPGQGA